MDTDKTAHAEKCKQHQLPPPQENSAKSSYQSKRNTHPETASYIDLLDRYGNHLMELGHAKNSIRVERCLAGEYLVYLEEIDYLEIMDAPTSTIHGFVASLRKTWKATSLGSALSVFRPFVRFIGREDLVYACESIRAPRKRAIIPVLEPDEHEALWEYINDPALTQRDRSIILLGLLAGLRACDIVSLGLGDIDWRMDTITIVQQKTGNPLTLPLVSGLGNAIASYIKDERPQSTCDKLFLRKRNPFTPIASSGAVYPIIKTAISKAGIALTGRCCGTRLLRHNAASAMLAKGFDVPTIAAVLGQADPMSAAAYITTDHEGLARCILPMVGMEVPS